MILITNKITSVFYKVSIFLKNNNYNNISMIIQKNCLDSFFTYIIVKNYFESLRINVNIIFMNQFFNIYLSNKISFNGLTIKNKINIAVISEQIVNLFSALKSLDNSNCLTLILSNKIVKLAKVNVNCIFIPIRHEYQIQEDVFNIFHYISLFLVFMLSNTFSRGHWSDNWLSICVVTSMLVEIYIEYNIFIKILILI
uniref:Uncharacterized protein n=1 Tax=Amorphochlora amoebiformis TaxID=1561963 RepID=A0A0H5BLT8_9EUKA|nr:hypothetical protein [Amorphochlora amoebiformis]